MAEIFLNGQENPKGDMQNTLYWTLDSIYDKATPWEERRALVEEAKAEATGLGLAEDEVEQIEHQVLSDRVAATEK